MCPKGDHEFPDEDDDGAHCEEHGVTLLFHGPPITPEDLGQECPRRLERPALGQANGPQDVPPSGAQDPTEAAYILFLNHGPACATCTGGRPCQEADDLQAASLLADIRLLTTLPPGVKVPGCKTLHVWDEDGLHEVARIEVGACSWCRKSVQGLVVVGIFPSDGGPGWDVHACEWCVRRHDLLPLADHPAGGWCTPIHRDGTPAEIRPSAP